MAREHQSGNDEARGPQKRRPYVAPELVEYGSIAKLTQSGSITIKDHGNMKQTGP
jgi:hypothetical protein